MLIICVYRLIDDAGFFFESPTNRWNFGTRKSEQIKLAIHLTRLSCYLIMPQYWIIFWIKMISNLLTIHFYAKYSIHSKERIANYVPSFDGVTKYAHVLHTLWHSPHWVCARVNSTHNIDDTWRNNKRETNENALTWSIDMDIGHIL